MTTVATMLGEERGGKYAAAAASVVPVVGSVAAPLMKWLVDSGWGDPKGFVPGVAPDEGIDPCNPPAVERGTPPWSAQQLQVWAAQCAAQQGGALAPTSPDNPIYRKCAPLSGLARSQCMAQVNRALNLRAAGQLQLEQGEPYAAPAQVGAPFYTQPLFIVGAGALVILGLALALK